MARIILPSYIKKGSGRMEDAVISQWKGVSYMKPYKKQTDAKTEKQQAVRKAFVSLVADWKYLNGVISRSWDIITAGENLTGFNAFIGENVKSRRLGEPVRLCHCIGEDILMNFSAETGASAGVIKCSFEPIPDGKHLTLFARKNSEPGTVTQLIRKEFGAVPASPVEISSLETGADYTIYGIVTDAAYSEANSVSDSVAAQAKAG